MSDTHELLLGELEGKFRQLQSDACKLVLERDALAKQLAGLQTSHDCWVENCKTTDAARIKAEKLFQIIRAKLDCHEKAAGFCEAHQPNGGTRNCVICGLEKLSAALSRISYLCDKPNPMQISPYDVHCNEAEVVKQVEHLIATICPRGEP